MVSANKTREAILKTLLYSDLFHFPLTEEELWQYLLADTKIARSSFHKELQHLVASRNRVMTQEQGYYALLGREAIITKRVRNLPEVAKKLRIVQRVSFWLSSIPTIYGIGLSGGLAVGDATNQDDIDLFLITKKDTMLITRLWVLVVLEILQLRRKRGKEYAPNKVCVNLFIDETQLQWKKSQQDVYIAHEIAQLKPLFERKHGFERFFSHNKWIVRFLPNSDTTGSIASRHADFFVLRILMLFCCLPLVRFIIEMVQIRIMKRHQTREIISQHLLAFHPIDYRSYVLQQLSLKWQQFGLLTNT
jgi:hypothetical protein